MPNRSPSERSSGAPPRWNLSFWRWSAYEILPCLFQKGDARVGKERNAPFSWHSFCRDRHYEPRHRQADAMAHGADGRGAGTKRYDHRRRGAGRPDVLDAVFQKHPHGTDRFCPHREQLPDQGIYRWNAGFDVDQVLVS